MRRKHPHSRNDIKEIVAAVEVSEVILNEKVNTIFVSFKRLVETFSCCDSRGKIFHNMVLENDI